MRPSKLPLAVLVASCSLACTGLVELPETTGDAAARAPNNADSGSTSSSVAAEQDASAKVEDASVSRGEDGSGYDGANTLAFDVSRLDAVDDATMIDAGAADARLLDGPLSEACIVDASADVDDPTLDAPLIDASATDGPLILPDTFIQATCVSSLNIGAHLQNYPARVDDGTPVAGAGIVRVVCSVVASGDGFDVALGASLNGPGDEFLAIAGHFTLQGASGVTGTFGESQTGTFTSNNCTVAFTYGGRPIVTSGGPVDPGRVWGHVSCPNAAGLNTCSPTSCDGEADFLFENCAE